MFTNFTTSLRFRLEDPRCTHVPFQFIVHERAIKSLVFNFRTIIEMELKIGEKSTILGLSIFERILVFFSFYSKQICTNRQEPSLLSRNDESFDRSKVRDFWAFNRLRSTTLEQICKSPRSIQGWSFNEERFLVWNPATGFIESTIYF